MFSAIKKGLGLSWRYKKVIVIFYVAILLLAVVVAYPLKGLITSTVGHSLMLEDLIKGFDYTFLNDFNNAYGAGFIPILNQSVVVIALYLLLFVFLTGGFLATFSKGTPSYDRDFFWGQSATFFWRMLRTFLVFTILHGLVFLLIWSVFYNMTSGFSPFDMETEETVCTAFAFIAPVYVIVASFFFLWQDYTKIILVKTNQKWLIKAMWQSLKFIIQNLANTYGVYMLNFLFWIVVLVLNYYLSSSVKINSTTTIFISFLFSQLFVITRLFLKLLLVGSLVSLQQNSKKG